MTLFWILAFNFLVAFLLFLYVRSSLARALKTEVLLEKVKTQVDELIREINSATDRNLSLVEIRLESLTSLMAEANIKMETLEAILKDSEHQREQLEALQAPEEPIYASPVNIVREGGRIAFSIDQTLKKQASVVLDSRPYREREDALPSLGTLESANSPQDRISREKEVVTLYNQGISYEMIAKKLKMDLGEVELIVSLRTRNSGRLF